MQTGWLAALSSDTRGDFSRWVKHTAPLSTPETGSRAPFFAAAFPMCELRVCLANPLSALSQPSPSQGEARELLHAFARTTLNIARSLFLYSLWLSLSSPTVSLWHAPLSQVVHALPRRF